jgi:hypothetical protein
MTKRGGHHARPALSSIRHRGEEGPSSPGIRAPARLGQRVNVAGIATHP